jgi:hypothetical protein
VNDIVKAWTFKSGSGGGFYQTLLYTDGKTSCDCKGWTRRCKNGKRSCKHTRNVDMNMADLLCERKVKYNQSFGAKAPVLQQGELRARHFDFAEN